MNSTFETGGDGGTATTHDWLTPPEILHALGAFDMDPCASQFQPWKTILFARPRRVELVQGGMVKDSGHTRKTLGGDDAVVWVVVEFWRN